MTLPGALLAAVARSAGLLPEHVLEERVGLSGEQSDQAVALLEERWATVGCEWAGSDAVRSCTASAPQPRL